jgi:parallel beta-helix repeat protein
MIRIKPGSYFLKKPLTITKKLSLFAEGDEDARITAPSTAVVLVCNSGCREAILFSGPGARGEVRGVTIKNSGGHGVAVRNGASAVLRQNVITSCQWSGVLVRNGSNGLIENNVIHGCDMGIQIEDKGSAATVRSNKLFDNVVCDNIDFCGNAEKSTSSAEFNLLGSKAKLALMDVLKWVEEWVEEAQQGDAATPWMHCRLMVLGGGGTGKTSCIKALSGAPFEQECESTVGAQVIKWTYQCESTVG